MKCEICHLNEAVRSIKRMLDGEERELFVCDSCARTSPHASTVPASLTDVLFSLGVQVGGGEKIEDNVCPACGMSRNEMREKHRLGCPKCFEVFETDIRTFLSAQPPAAPLPAGASQPSSGLVRLKTELEQAVAEERYEDAAVICEKIRQAGVQNESEDGHGTD